MDGSLSTLLAVLGTLLGAALTHFFQRAADRRSQDFAAQQQLRSERMQVYSDFAGAVADFRRGQRDRWHRRHEDPEGPAAFEARVESYRLRSAALHALFRVQLIASGPVLVEAARRAYEMTSGAHRGDTHEEVNALAVQARDALEDFIVLAAADVR